MLLSTNFGI